MSWREDINKFEAADRAPKPYRNEVVKDNYNDFNDKFYGNNNVMVSKQRCPAWHPRFRYHCCCSQ